MIKEPKVTILDCTLRDGSYVIDYQFTTEDTYLICLGLVKAGFRYIEIGHGTGLGSVRAGKGDSAASDEEYMDAALSAIEGSDAHPAFFFIPGVGTMKDLEIAASRKIDFIRIGTNTTEIEQALPYIQRAKELGMMVSLNLMKSYVVPTGKFSKLAVRLERYGVDVIVVVDSAGGMLPADIREYVRSIREAVKTPIGFHGHNNLHLAIANTLEAVKAGATIVDSTLQGMGRSAGNAQTEILAVLLEKMGHHTGIDIYRTMDLGERLIKPMMSRSQGVDDISLVSGIAQFHSSFFKVIEDVAKKYRIDPRRLILEVSESNRVHISYDLAEKVALKIKNASSAAVDSLERVTVNKDTIRRRTFKNVIDQANSFAGEIMSLSKKTGKSSVFCITVSRREKTIFPYIRQSSSLVIGNVEAANLNVVSNLVDELDGRVDWILFDRGEKILRTSGLDAKITRSRFTWYSEQRVLRLSVNAALAQRRSLKKVLILADKVNTELMALSLRQQGIIAVKSIKAALKEWKSISAVVSFGEEYARELKEALLVMNKRDTIIYAVCPRAYPSVFWNAVVRQGNFVCRVDSRLALSSELELAIETAQSANSMGSGKIAGVQVVAGGVIGPCGSVVVDALPNPMRVIGVADGQGGILNEDKETAYVKNKEVVSEELVRNLYKKEY